MTNAILKTVVLRDDQILTLIEWAEDQLELLNQEWRFGDLNDHRVLSRMDDMEEILRAVGDFPKALEQTMCRLRDTIREDADLASSMRGAPEGDGLDD